MNAGREIIARCWQNHCNYRIKGLDDGIGGDDGTMSKKQRKHGICSKMKNQC